MLTDEQIDAAWESVKWKDLNVNDVGHAIILRRRFARAILSQAFESAAKVCDELAEGWSATAQGHYNGTYDHMTDGADRCADEIRALIPPKEPT